MAAAAALHAEYEGRMKLMGDEMMIAMTATNCITGQRKGFVEGSDSKGSDVEKDL